MNAPAPTLWIIITGLVLGTWQLVTAPLFFGDN